MYYLWMMDRFQRNLVKNFSGTIFYHSILTQPPPSTPVLSEPLWDHDLSPTPEERLCLNHLYLQCLAHGLPQSLTCVSLIAQERGIEIFGSFELLGVANGTLVYSGRIDKWAFERLFHSSISPYYLLFAYWWLMSLEWLHSYLLKINFQQ